MPRVSKFIETESRLVVFLVSLGENGMTANGWCVSFGGNKNIKNDYGKKMIMVNSQLCEYTKSYWTVCFK